MRCGSTNCTGKSLKSMSLSASHPIGTREGNDTTRYEKIYRTSKRFSSWNRTAILMLLSCSFSLSSATRSTILIAAANKGLSACSGGVYFRSCCVVRMQVITMITMIMASNNKAIPTLSKLMYRGILCSTYHYNPMHDNADDSG